MPRHKSMGAPRWLQHRSKKSRGNRTRQADGLDKSQPDSMAGMHAAFLENLGMRNYAPITIENVRKNLVLFLRWGEERGLVRPQDITRPVVESYQLAVYRYRQASGRPLSITAQRARLGAVRMFFKWLCRQQVILYNPASEMEMPRMEQRLPEAPLSATEMEQILSTPDVGTVLGLRDRAILETLYSTALRRQELARLEMQDIYVERRVLFVRQGKGHKDRYVPLGTRALLWLEKYLRETRCTL